MEMENDVEINIKCLFRIPADSSVDSLIKLLGTGPTNFTGKCSKQCNKYRTHIIPFFLYTIVNVSFDSYFVSHWLLYLLNLFDAN